MLEILQFILPEFLFRLVAPMLGKLTRIPWLALDPPSVITMAYEYRYVSIRVRNRGNVAIEGARIHLQSYRDQQSGGEVLTRDELMPWVEDQDFRGTMGDAVSLSKRIPPGSGEAQIAVAVARADDNTQMIDMCIASREDPDDAATMLVVWPSAAPAIVSIRVVGDDYASRPIRIRLCVTDAGENTWQTVQAERVSWLRDAIRLCWCILARVGGYLDRKLRVSRKPSQP